MKKQQQLDIKEIKKEYAELSYNAKSQAKKAIALEAVEEIAFLSKNISKLIENELFVKSGFLGTDSDYMPLDATFRQKQLLLRKAMIKLEKLTTGDAQREFWYSDNLKAEIVLAAREMKEGEGND